MRVYTCCVLASILCAGCAHNDSGVSAGRGIGYVLLGIAVADVLTESGAAIYHEAKGIEHNGELIGVRLGVSAAIGLAGAILISSSQNEKETVKPIQALGSKSFGETCRAGSECKSRLCASPGNKSFGICSVTCTMNNGADCRHGYVCMFKGNWIRPLCYK